ncbi:TetR/AcrR family transcriptional regulator [Nocardioides limicola]|uniref:TetR/AcrR family transcriptional regulator n=1 Tax=Nocardioides limicola TaxID=2803368 RepID=UPI00193C50DE|nr:TetR/AcrR family transcriptional regulator [Nocardioides sp. DJM-14]
MPTATRRERQREATFEEIVSTSRDLLAAGEELSLRAIAARMGMTAPALYRYVANYQELVDLVAFEIDKAATDLFRAAADRHRGDPAASAMAAAVAFRRWGQENPREFGLVFANPVAESACLRRDLITISHSCRFMNDLLIDLHERHPIPHPTRDELPPGVLETVVDPVMPVDLDRLTDENRGLLWVFMRVWAALYGVVTLEVFGHIDPRLIESGVMFRDMIANLLTPLGLTERAEELLALVGEELNR